MIKMIICSDKSFGIGKNNQLLTHIPEDLKYFKEQTQESVVVMGRKTFDSLPFKNGLPNRKNIVVSSIPKKSAWLYGEVTWVCSIDPILNWFGNFKYEDVWVIGGASVYSQFKDIVEEVHYTKINKTFPEADTFFDMSFVEDENVFEKVSTTVLCDIASVSVYKRK